MRSLLTFLFFALPVQAAAAQGGQFDLRCTGAGSSVNGSQKFDGPMTRVLHVDLVNKQYCVDACETVLRVALVDPVRITFLAFNNKGGALDLLKGSEAVVGALATTKCRSSMPLASSSSR